MLFDVWIFIERVFQKKPTENPLREFACLVVRYGQNKRFGNTFENQTEKQNSDRIPDEVFILADEL